MEKGIRVKDILPGTHASGVFLIREAALARTRNGSPYWNLILADASGSMEAKIWHPLSNEFSQIPQGSFANIHGGASLFRDKCQLVIEKFSLLTEEERNGITLADFMPASPWSIPAMFSELCDMAEREFTHGPWHNLFESVFGDKELRQAFCMAPAATGVHHAYAGGLLEHSLSVARLCLMLAQAYPELDRQTLLAGAILHDIGKTREISSGVMAEYTQSGKLMGHIFLGLELLAPHIASSALEPWLAEHLQHLLLSHHGKLEFGAPRLPQTAEALALHYADNLDAKLAQCRSLFKNTDARPGWSPWQATLGRSILWARPTPDSRVPVSGEPEYMDWMEEEAEPTPDELAEIYADPAFNEPPGWDDAIPPDCSPAASYNDGHAARQNRRDNQCSLL